MLGLSREKGREMKVNRDKFFDGWRQEFGPLAQQQVDGCNVILDVMEAEDERPVGYAAYSLATAYHETAHTMQPIEEIGKGRKHTYGQPDPITGQTYYGRGYVQLTWKTNYQNFGTVLGLPLLQHPELALVPATAYRIMSLGMRQGLFTGKKLGDYISDQVADYHNARRIINGLDRADLIAGYAEKFEMILKDSVEAPDGQTQT